MLTSGSGLVLPAVDGSHSSPVSSGAPAIHVGVTPDFATSGISQTNSQNWAGYAVTAPTAAVTDVRMSWTVPEVTCSSGSTTDSVVWVGIDGWTDSTVEQIGTGSDCSSGTAYFF